VYQGHPLCQTSVLSTRALEFRFTSFWPLIC
jgi:hypothetical protein